MSTQDIDLKSVNWKHGMLLSPEHFLQQERYLESKTRWLARYCVATAGLVGNGIRPVLGQMISPMDPVVFFQQDERELKIVISDVRAISTSGQIFELDATNPAQRIFPLEELAGLGQLDIYVISHPEDKIAVQGQIDEDNPDMVSSQIQHYTVGLNLADNTPFSPRVLVARLVRAAKNQRFELQSDFIPPCASVTAHSEMQRAWKKTLEQLESMAEKSIELHRSIVEYLSLCEGKDLDLTVDRETLDFVGRLVIALENCIYEIMESSTSPEMFLQELYRLVRSSAVFLQLSPPTRTYFQHLADAGESEFLPLVEQQLNTLSRERKWISEGDLASELSRLNEGLYRLRRLVEALGGKYLDYRLSPSLEALGFVIDRDSETLFKAVSKIAHSQATANESTFVFARMQLEGRERYRIILIGNQQASFQINDVIKATIRINVGGGTAIPPIYQEAVCKVAGQKNFAIDFETREIAAITDIRISVRSDHLVKSAMLYTRKLLFAAAKPSQRSTVLPSSAEQPDVVHMGRPERPQPSGTVPSPYAPPLKQPETPVKRKYLLTDPGTKPIHK
jgi:hypothetical protein